MRRRSLALPLLFAACSSTPTATSATTDAASADATQADTLAPTDATSDGDGVTADLLGTDADAASIADALVDVVDPSDTADTISGDAAITDAPTPDADIAAKDIAASDLADTSETLDIAPEIVADAADTASDASPTGCQDLRKLGDDKVPMDSCWAPPTHYCSAKQVGIVAFVCKPDFTACMYGSCRPCGWIGCPMTMPSETWPAWAHPKCPKDWQAWLPGYNGEFASLAVPYLPDPNATICWDNAPAEWSTDAFHANEELAPTK